MAVTESLYQRHDDLETEFANCLLPELEREAKGRFSMFLLRRMTPYFDGRTYRSEEVQKVEWLYKELVALKKKLGEPISPGPVAIVRKYEVRPNARDLQGESRIRFARLRLAEFTDYMMQKQQSIRGKQMSADGLTRRFQPTRRKRGRLNRRR